MATRMNGDSDGRWGIARTFALILGLGYLALALAEAIAQDAWQPVLEYRALQNGVHWAVGAVLLVSCFAGEETAKLVLRVAGVVFLALTVWGVVARASLGTLLGFDHPLPWAAEIVYALTAVAALSAGFAVRDRFSRLWEHPRS
jgi:uncharacterized membrane protein